MRLARALASAIASVSCILILASCGEEADVPTDLGPRPARVYLVSVLDTDQREFRYGEEISVTFDKHPGWVALDYGDEEPITPLRAQRLRYTFLLERSPTVLRWSWGGSLFLEYDPIIRREPRVPVLTGVWPKFGAQHVSYDNINTRTEVNFTFDTEPNRWRELPRFHVDVAQITGPDGEMWEPSVRMLTHGFSLARRRGATYERGQTYRVHVEVTFLIAPDGPQTYDYQFRVQD